MMIIQAMQAAQMDDLVAFWQAAFPGNPRHNAPASMIAAKQKVDDLIYVGLQQEQIIAACMAGYDGHRGWLYAVAVDTAQRRKGYGQQMVEHAVQALQARGCIKVNLQVRIDNAEAAAFYESLGFKTEQRLSMGKLLVDAK